MSRKHAEDLTRRAACDPWTNWLFDRTPENGIWYTRPDGKETGTAHAL